MLNSEIAFALEKYPIRIVPAENIATTHDEVELGDKLLFKVKSDVYIDSNLLFKKDTLVIGVVEFMQDNGWANDNAEIHISKFILKDVSDEVITIESPIQLNGFELLKTKGKRFLQFFNYFGILFRGKEVDIKSGVDKAEFTIWYTK